MTNLSRAITGHKSGHHKGEQMTLSDFLSIINPIKTEASAGQFMYSLFDNFIRDPSPSERELEDPNNHETFFNPFRKHYTNIDTLKKIANGSRNLSSACASELCNLYDNDKLEGFFSERSDDYTDVCAQIQKHGFELIEDDTGPDHITTLCKLLYKIIYNIANEKLETLPPLEKLCVKSLHEDAFKRSYVKENTIYIGSHKISFPYDISDIKKDDSLPYVYALLEVYSEKTGIEYKTVEELESNPRLLAHFNDQKRKYLLAEAMSHNVRDLFIDAEENLTLLKNELNELLRCVFVDLNAHNGYTRLTNALTLASSAQLNSTILLNIKGLVCQGERLGLCHILVNDKYITSWVEV